MRDCSRNENVAPPVKKSMAVARECSVCKELFDDVKAQERAIENLPDPPQVDGVNEIEKRLEKLKRFNKKWLVDRKVGATAKESKVEVKIAKANPKVFGNAKVNVSVAAGKIKENAGANCHDVDTIVMNENILDMDANGSTKSHDINDVMYKQVHCTESNKDRVDNYKGRG